MIHSIEYCKYGTAHKNLDVLLYGILLGQEYLTVLGSIFIVVDVEILRVLWQDPDMVSILALVDVFLVG